MRPAMRRTGKEVFKKCSLCHATEAGKNKIGPSLAGVVGRDAGTAPNFNYSDAMKNSKKKWTAEELDTYLTEPRKDVPGTKMIFPGLKDERSPERHRLSGDAEVATASPAASQRGINSHRQSRTPRVYSTPRGLRGPVESAMRRHDGRWEERAWIVRSAVARGGSC